MHDVHSNASHSDSDNDAQQNGHPKNRVQCQNQKVWRQEYGEKDNRFQMDFPVAGFFDVVLLKVTVDAGIKRPEKPEAVVFGECRNCGIHNLDDKYSAFKGNY
jgi:hypothetical protein